MGTSYASRSGSVPLALEGLVYQKYIHKYFVLTSGPVKIIISQLFQGFSFIKSWVVLPPRMPDDASGK